MVGSKLRFALDGDQSAPPKLFVVTNEIGRLRSSGAAFY